MLASMQIDSDAPSDEDLLAAIASRDKAAFSMLIDRHMENVRSLSWRLLNNHADVDDIAQDVFLKLWNKPDSFKPGNAKFSTWLYRVTKNACIDKQRKMKNSTGLEVVELTYADNKPDPESQLVANSQAEQVNNAIAKLPPRQAQAISLSHFEGVSNIEAAQILEVSVEAVESLLGRARRSLKATLEPQIRNLLTGGN